ncbi:MAG: hypothetical protein A2137_03740 [Chloroflexi bacterium RBG_16_58_8]|nr:MAG: hypothetical protein A2137_03740 [Chloroflexi bacterium RBG_16_58_8]
MLKANTTSMMAAPGGLWEVRIKTSDFELGSLIEGFKLPCQTEGKRVKISLFGHLQNRGTNTLKICMKT